MSDDPIHRHPRCARGAVRPRAVSAAAMFAVADSRLIDVTRVHPSVLMALLRGEQFWTCGECGRRSAYVFPGGTRKEPRFWYDFNGVLKCKDCSWKETATYKKTGQPPSGGWYPPNEGQLVLEHPGKLGDPGVYALHRVDGAACWCGGRGRDNHREDRRLS